MKRASHCAANTSGAASSWPNSEDPATAHDCQDKCRFPRLRHILSFTSLPAMKFWNLATSAVFLASISSAEEPGKTKPTGDPFADLKDLPVVADYSIEVDRTRGSFLLDATDGKYIEGAHFAKWEWKLEAPRPGNYHVGLIYVSTSPSLGVQVRISDAAVLKIRVPSTNIDRSQDAFPLGQAFLPDAGEYPITMLTSDQSNVPSCRVKAIEFRPAPDSEISEQSIDGSILLEGKTATTYSDSMRYDAESGNNCLSFWTSEKDWAE